MGKKRMVMRFVVGILATIMLVGGTTSMQAQTHVKEPVNIYFTAKEMPDMRKFMPAPPDTFGIQ